MKRADERKKELNLPFDITIWYPMIAQHNRRSDEYKLLNASKTSCGDTSKHISCVKHIFLGVHLSSIRSTRKLNVSRLTVTVLWRVLIVQITATMTMITTTAMATAASRRRTSMADDNRGVSVVPPLSQQPTSPLLPPLSPPHYHLLRCRRRCRHCYCSWQWLHYVLAVQWCPVRTGCTCTLRTFRPLVRSISSAVATRAMPPPRNTHSVSSVARSPFWSPSL